VFLNDMPLFVVIFMLAATALLLTQVVINTATAAMLLPIAASLSLTLDVEPALLLIPVAVATSLGFILPIGTPPNTVVLGSGYVTARQMARAGAPLSLLLLVVITVLLYILVPAVFS
jgi:sodium-dependent dicarboxylate transporter 2/3/5